MQKNRLISLLKENGDSTIIFTNRSVDPIVATTDFKNKYIRAKGSIRIPKKGIIIWDWTNDRKRIINHNEVFKVIPLSQTLNNQRDI